MTKIVAQRMDARAKNDLKRTNKRTKKMKKTLWSMVAGLAVIGSAFAVPSLDTQRTRCDDDPEHFVWVERTQACVPLNPCLSDMQEIVRGYCSGYYLPADISQQDFVIDKMLKSWGTSLFAKKDLGDGYIALITYDGRYSVHHIIDSEHDFPKTLALKRAFEAYGYESELESWFEDDEEYHGNYDVASVKSSEECEDIKNFAVMLNEKSVEKWEYKNGKCRLYWFYVD